MNNIRAKELGTWLKEQTKQVQLVDVRSRSEFRSGAIEGFVNIPLDEIMTRTEELDQDNPLVIMCMAGSRSMMAARQLEHAGFNDIWNVLGGLMAF